MVNFFLYILLEFLKNEIEKEKKKQESFMAFY